MAFLWRQQIGPIDLQRIAVDDLCRLLQRNAREALPEGKAQFVIGNMVGHPHRHLGNARGEFFIFDAVKLIDIDERERRDVHHPLAVPQFVQHGEFQRAQFAIGNHQKIAAATGRVHKGQAGQFVLEFAQQRSRPVLRAFILANSAFNSSRNNGPMTFRIFASVV